MPIQKNILWYYFGNIIYVGTQWLITVLVTRRSGLSDAGILSLAMSISALFQTIAFFGMHNYQVSDIEKKYSDSLYIQSRFITCIVALVICIFFTLFNRYQFSQLTAILLFMFFRISEAFSDVFHGIFQKNNHLDLVGKGLLCKGIAVIIFFAVGYYSFNSLNFGLTCMVAGALFITLLYDFQRAKKISFFEINIVPQIRCAALLKETAPLCVCVCLQSTISTIPKYILEKMCDEVALGAYSSIFAPAMLIQTVAAYIFIPFIGQFSEYYQNREGYKFRKLALQISMCILLMGAIAVSCANLVGWRILIIVFGTAISAYEYLLIPILFCTLANAFFVFYSMLSVVIRDYKGQIISCLLGFLLCAASTVVCVSRFGINGASYGLFIGTLFAVFILIVRVIWVICRMELRQTKDKNRN